MKVLYVEDNPHDSELTLRELARSAPDIHVEVAPSIALAMAQLGKIGSNLSNGGKSDFDVVLLNLNLGDGSGLKILSHIRLHSLPLAVVVLTGSGDEEIVITVLRTGADDYHIKRDNYRAQLPATLRAALANSKRRNARRSQALRLLYVESNEHDVHLTRLHLDAHAPFIEFESCPTALRTLNRLPASGPVKDVDVVLMDYHLAGMSGLEALREIHHVRGLDIPVILITGHGTEEIALQSLKLGAVDYIINSPGYLHHLPYSVENAFFRVNAQRERNALIKREKEFHTLANNLPSIVWRFDPGLRTLYANPAIETAFGISATAFFGRTAEEAGLPAEELAAWQSAIKNVFQTGEEKRLEFQYTSPAGLKHWDAQIVPERRPDGTIESVLLIAHDITEREQAEEELRSSEATKSRIMNSALDMICTIDAGGRFREVGAGCKTIFGFEPSELIGRPYVELLHPEDREEALSIAPLQRAGDAIADFQNRCLSKDKTVLDITWSANWSEADQTIYCVGRDETLRNRSKEEARQLALRLKTTLESITDAFFTLDLNWCFSYINPHADHLLRRSRDELLGKNIWHEFPEAKNGIFFREYHRAMANNCTVEIEEFYEPLAIWLQAKAYPSPEGLAVYFRDSSDRKRSKEKLQQNSAFIQSVLNSLTEHICVLDNDGNIVEVNAAWRKFAEENGGEKKAYLGQSYLEICRKGDCLGSENDAEIAVRGISSVLDGSQSQFVLEYPCHSATRKLWFLMRVTPLSEARQGVVVSHEDITERKKSELAVEQSEKRFRSLIENGSDLITVVNGKGVIQFQSPSSLRVLGFTSSELTGHRAFDFIHPEDISRVADAIQGAVLYPTSPFTVQYRFRDCNDSWRFFESVGRNIPSESADGFIVLNSRDITDTRKLEEQFRQAQKMEAIGQLSGGVAHDFNNILTVIQGHASLLQLEENISPRVRESADEILIASERAANLTRQLLTFSRRQAMQPRDLDLNEVVSNMTKMFQRLLGEDIQIQINYDSKSLQVHADPGMMEQILLNLAVNSRDAMPKGGHLVIETSTADFEDSTSLPSVEARSGSFVCLTVSDTGMGIPKHILSRIFEPFFTTKAVGKGTGLGLATVYGIVQQHQGWLTVYSEENHGTTFRVYLPRAIAKFEKPVVAPVVDSVRGGDETILVVEDEPSLRILVRNVLSKLGYRILEAPTGVSALKVWKQNRAEIMLVITDLVMPDGMTGIDLGRHLVKEDPHLRIIYTSGYSAEIAGKNFPLVEGTNFISKPFAPRKLAQTVRARLDE
ncbi:MAG: PAS domain S-box protein [Verrucomicrobiota bacterium]